MAIEEKLSLPELLDFFNYIKGNPDKNYEACPITEEELNRLFNETQLRKLEFNFWLSSLLYGAKSNLSLRTLFVCAFTFGMLFGQRRVELKRLEEMNKMAEELNEKDPNS